MYGLLVAHRDAAQILGREFRPPDDVRDQRDHQFLALAVDAFPGEQPAQNRDTGEPGNAGNALALLVLGEPSQKLHGAFTHPDIVRNFSLADDGLVKAAQEHGLIVRPLFGERVALCPPLIITEDQIAEMYRRCVEQEVELDRVLTRAGSLR